MTLPNGDIQGAAAPAPGSVDPNDQQQQTPPEGTPGASQTPDGKQVPLSALQDERQKRQDAQAQLSLLQQEIAGLKDMIGQQQQQQQYQQQPPQMQQQQNPVDNVWNNEEAWNRDPKGAVRQSVQAEIMAALQWYDGQNAVVSRQEAEVMRKYPDYVKFKQQVDQQLRTIPFAQRTQPGVVETAYFMVRGQNVDQMLTAQQQELIEKIKRGELVQGLNPGTFQQTPQPGAGQVQLTPDEQKAAAMMNLTPEQYASAKVSRQ